MRQLVVKNVASSAGRWLDVAPDRFPGWIADFAQRHGDSARGAGLAVALPGGQTNLGQGALGGRAVPPGESLIFSAPDGAVADCYPPFPPVAGLAVTADPAEPDPDLSAVLDPGACAEAVAAHALAPRTVGVLLVRLGGYAVGVFTGSPPGLQVSKTGSRLVHGRSAAGGWSQHRFARRRQKQAAEALQAAADAAAAVFGRWAKGPPADNSNKRGGHAPVRPGHRNGASAAHAGGKRGTGLDAVVLGGDKRAVTELRADPRLLSYVELATDRFLTVPDPKLAVLKDAPRLYLAVRIWLREPAT